MEAKRYRFDMALKIEKKMDSLGRFVVPKPMVVGYGWQEQDEILFVPSDDNHLMMYNMRLLDGDDLLRFGGYNFLSSTFDDLGRVVIPMEYRREMHIADKKKKHSIVVAPGKNCIIVGTTPMCCFCGTRENLIYTQGTRGVCADCGSNITHTMEKNTADVALTAV